MTFEQSIVNLMQFSRNTYYVWKRENRPIISLLEKYFTKENLEEFLQSGKIDKFENLKNADRYITQLYKRWLDPYDSPVFVKIVDFYFLKFTQNYMATDEDGYLTDTCIASKYQDINYGGVQTAEMFISFILDSQYQKQIEDIIQDEVEDFINLANHKTKLIYSIAAELSPQELDFLLVYKYHLEL